MAGENKDMNEGTVGGRSEGYLPQLDGVRAIACIFVLYAHLFPLEAIHELINWGHVGVLLFFVLSGFLITGILLDARTKSNDLTDRTTILRGFYARRALRIFPLYYATLGAGLLLLPPADPLETASYLTFTCNWYILGIQDHDLLARHFWSLAVEEQFYLLWPWLILYLPRRYLLPAILTAIVFAPLLRFGLVAAKCSLVATYFNTAGCLDSLGCGGLLAYLRRMPDDGATARRFMCGAGILAVPVCVVSFPWSLWPTHYYLIFSTNNFFWSILAFIVVGLAAEGIGGRILGRGPLAYLGRISYGVYVYHAFLSKVENWAGREFGSLGWMFPTNGYTRAIMVTALSIIVADISWRLYEGPINALKRYFPYVRRQPLTKVNS